MKRKEFVDYWNDWMQEWFNKSSASIFHHTVVGEIKKWPSLEEKGGSFMKVEKPAWHFFPEPYWGDPLSENLKAVFINFNPGEGGDGQHIEVKSAGSEIYKRFPAENYYQTVTQLYKLKNYPTTKYLKSGRREGFVKKVNKTHDERFESVMFEMCPWHTKSVTPGVYSYIKNMSELVDRFILQFAAECSKSVKGNFERIILAHGLDVNTVSANFQNSHLKYIRSEYIGINLSKKWTIDIFQYAIDRSDVTILNFKNSSNSFPAVNDELLDFFRKNKWFK